VASAQQTRDLERGRRSVAEREWKLLGDGTKADDSAKRRALREPQRASALAAVRAAEAGVSKARLAAARTRIKTPFNALVVEEGVEAGQVVQPGVRLGKLVGTDAFWVQVSVPVADLDWLDIPGARATVTHRSGTRVVKRRGTVVRMLGDLDPLGSMARLVVEVPDPLGLKNEAKPLLLGAFVEVALEGRSADHVYELPRVALREGDRVWRVDADQRLVSGPVTVLRRMRATVLVSKGLADGDRVITSRLASPVPGMELRVKPSETKPTAEAAQ
jgi:RND family efflux transporter MFP subunit